MKQYTIHLSGVGTSTYHLVKHLIAQRGLDAAVEKEHNNWEVTKTGGPMGDWELSYPNCVIRTTDANTAVMLKLLYTEHILACD